MLNFRKMKKAVLLGGVVLLALACGLPGGASEPEPQPTIVVEEVPPEPTMEEPTATPSWSPNFLYQVEVGEEKIDSLAIMPDGETFVIAGFSFINLYKLDNGEFIHATEFESVADNMVFSSDGSILGASFLHGQVMILDPIDGSLIEQIVSRGNEARIDISPNGELMATSQRGNVVTFWNATDYSQIQQIDLPTSEWTTSLRFSPSGNFLAAARFNQYVNIIDSKSFEVIETLERGEFSLIQNHGLAFSPDEAFLAVVDVKIDWNDHVRVWGMGDYQVHVDLPVPYRANDIHFSPDGSMMAAGIQSQTSVGPKTNQVMIWSVPEFELLYQLELQSDSDTTDNITTLRFSPDSSKLVIARWNGVAEVWQVKP